MTSAVLVNLGGVGASFEAVEIVGRWNGWAIPRMTVEVARAVADYIARDARDDTAEQTAGEIRAAIVDKRRADGTVVLNLGLCFSEVEPEEPEEPAERAPASLPRAALGYVAAVATSNLVRWAMTWAATEITKENERARVAQTSKREAERAALVSEIRARRTEADPMLGDADPARAFQLAQRELFMVTRGRVPSVRPVPWSELEQIPIGGYEREAQPTEGVVAAHAGRVFVVVQLRKPEGWDPVWCLLSLSGDVCGWTEADEAARVRHVEGARHGHG